MLKIILGIGLALVLIVVIVTLVGMRLPVQHVASRTVTLPAAPESVFAVISDFTTAPSWRKDVKRVDVLPDERGVVRFTETGGNGSMTMEVTELSPPSRLVTRIVGEGLAFGGAWAYALEPIGGGTRITITEHGEVYNPIFRFVSRFIMGHTSTLDTYLTNLGRKYSEPVTPVDGPLVPLK